MYHQIELYLNQNLIPMQDFDRIRINISQHDRVHYGHGPFGWFDQHDVFGFKQNLAYNFAASTLVRNTQFNSPHAFKLLPINVNISDTTAQIFLRLYKDGEIVSMSKWLNPYGININNPITFYIPEDQLTRCLITTETIKSCKLKNKKKISLKFLKWQQNYVRKNHQKYLDYYFIIAPIIISQIEKQEECKEIYNDIWNKYLSLVLEIIDIEKSEQAFGIFVECVKKLSDKYLCQLRHKDHLQFMEKFEQYIKPKIQYFTDEIKCEEHELSESMLIEHMLNGKVIYAENDHQTDKNDVHDME